MVNDSVVPADGKLAPLDFMLLANSRWGQVEGDRVEYNPGLKLVLKARVDVNLRDLEDKTPLLRLVESQNFDFAKILVSAHLFRLVLLVIPV